MPEYIAWLAVDEAIIVLHEKAREDKNEDLRKAADILAAKLKQWKGEVIQ